MTTPAIDANPATWAAFRNARASRKASFVNPIDLAKLPEMCERTVDIDDADPQLLPLVSRENRESESRSPGPATPLSRRPTRKDKKRSNPRADPLLCVDEYSHEGSIGPTADRDIDCTIYDI